MNQLLAMRAFARVVETGSFAKAADHLSLPRSSTSKLVADLEAHLGTKLVMRTTRRVSITPEGMAYHDHVIRLLAELDDADAAVRGARLTPRGRLRVDVPPSIARHILIPALPDFHRRYPEISVMLGVSDRQVNIVGEDVDCVIRGGEIRDPALIARKLTELEYGTFAAPTYIDRRGLPNAPGDLRQGHVAVGYFSSTTERPQPLVFQKGKESVEIVATTFSANDGEAHICMTMAGLGVGQHFVRFVQGAIDEGKLVRLLPDWCRPAFPLYAVYVQDRHRSTRLSVFLDWLIATFK